MFIIGRKRTGLLQKNNSYEEVFVMDNRDQRMRSRVAIKDDLDRKITYGELWDNVEKLKQIVETRSFIFILCDNSLETLSFYFKTICLKAVPLLLSAEIDDLKLQYLVKIYNPEFIWTKGSRIGLTEICVLYDNDYRLWKTKAKKKILNDELALILMTSGSTGNSKTVRISYHNLRDSIEASVNFFSLREDDRTITTLPMNFTYGLAILHMHWHIGALVLTTYNKVFNDKFWTFFEKEQVTNFAGVSFTYKLLKAGGFLKRKYPSLRFVSQAGDRMPEDLLKLFIEAMPNVKFYKLYGQTEGTVFLCGLNCKNVNVPYMLQSVGKPLGNWKVEIRNKDRSGIGEIFILGDTVSMGYASTDEDLALGDINQGCLNTGDLGRLDENGNLFIQGRKSRFVKLMGTRVNLDDIEEAIRNAWPHIGCACKGEDDNLILYHTQDDINSEELRYFISKFVHINEKLISVKYKDEIPKTLSGKVNYGGLN